MNDQPTTCPICGARTDTFSDFHHTNLKLLIHESIPPDYVGRRIEVMYYPVDELIEEKPAAVKNMSSFRGLLSEAEGNALLSTLKQ